MSPEYVRLKFPSSGSSVGQAMQGRASVAVATFASESDLDSPLSYLTVPYPGSPW